MRTLEVIDQDIALTEGSPTVIEGVNALAQRIRHRLALFAGEWYLDTSIGVDWLSIFGQKPSPESFTQIVTLAVEADPEVKRVIDVQTEFNNKTRTLSGSFKCETLNYGTVEGTV